MKITCAHCEQAMECNPQPGAACWCASQPAMKPQPGATGCLCPDCLRIERERQAAEAYDRR